MVIGADSGMSGIRRFICIMLCVLFVLSLTPVYVLGTPEPQSGYKHISHSGAPYNIDAITGATLTVEGPGVEKSVPITVRELEGTAQENISRGVYSDNRGAGTTKFSYEGVTLLSILEGKVNAQVVPNDDEIVVVFKNRWRQEIGRLTYNEIKRASSPVIIAYGTAGENETDIAPAPFVFTGATGYISALGNGDGPLKLVYDQNDFPGLGANSPFSSVAYLYVEEGTPPPGYKHSETVGGVYSDKTNTEYLVTLTGSALGREVNLTVEELEEMVTYGADNKPEPGGIGHRSEYSLSNTTYWYVNEYEGVKVWDLLKRLGLDGESYKNDDSTLVSFSAWDNYLINAQFSMKQLANPELFYFYEKSPLDIGTNRPTKAQLATPEYMPDNQMGTWVQDDNGYPVKTGYPVLLAYGVNGYPYVRNSNLEGYMSGLGNDGGPMRVIYGKTDGLNRADPMAIENYAYFFNNGSNQLQRVQEIYVGDDTRYSTHLENPDYMAMKDSPDALTVVIIGGGTTVVHTFTLAELESILYGAGITKRDRDNEGRQEKGYYYYKNAGNGSAVEDLFEGVSLEYLLTDYIGMQSTIGSVELYKGDNTVPDAVYDLSALAEPGYNSLRGTGGLGAVIAFAKNGYPLVSGSGSDGYISTDPETGITIKNSGGPLQFVRGQTQAERDLGSIIASGDTSSDEKTSVENLTKIIVRLDSDIYAHVGGDYADYALHEIRFTGAVAASGGVSLTVGALETKLRYMATGEYTVDGNRKTYRGLNLAAFLNDSAVGASALMSGITVKNASGVSYTLTVAELAAKNAILAYGIQSSGGTDGRPLVPTAGDAGYDAAFENSGGPMRLVFEGGTNSQCVTGVSEIVVSAAELDGWKHTTGSFAQYADYTLEISGQNLINNKTYTVADIEAMDNIITVDTYQMGGTYFIQGAELYKLLSNIGFADSLDTSDFTAYAIDGYATLFKGSDLKNGVNGKPILVAFGQGTSADNGLPLVPDTTSPGYDPNIGNAFGPLRLVVNDNSGWCVKYLSKIVVGAARENPDPETEPVFESLLAGEGFPNAGVRSITEGPGGIWAGTYGGGLVYLPESGTGVTVYDTASSPALLSDFASAAAADASGGVWFSQNASYTTPGENRGVGYMKDGEITWYRAFDVPATIPDDYVQAIEIDSGGNVWFGSFGGVTKYDGESFTTWTKADGLPASSVNTIAFDGAGGVLVGCYPDGAGTREDPFTGGWAYINAGGEIDFVKSYTAPYDETIGSSLLADAWVRGIAADGEGGVWVVRSGSYADLPNEGGRVDYVDADRNITSYTGKDLLGAELTVTAALNPEIRAVTVDKNGGVWFGTSGGGLFLCSQPGSVYKKYSYSEGSWRDALLDNIYCLKFIGDTLYVGTNGGIAWAEPELIEPYEPPAATVLDPPFTIKQGGKADVEWVIGGSGNSIKNLPDNAGKLVADFNYNGTQKTVRGARLYDILTASGVTGEDKLVTITTTDGFYRTNYQDITLSEIAAGDYFLAYDVYNNETGEYEKVGDVDGNYIQASVRIYRAFDGGASGEKNNEIKGVGGVTVSVKNAGGGSVNPGTGSVGDTTVQNAELTITGAVENPGYFTIAGLKTYPGVTARTRIYTGLNSYGTKGQFTMTGVYLEDLLKDVMTLSPNAESITVTASDNYHREFNLDSEELGVYWTDNDGNKLMLAWQENGTDCALRLVVGQTDPGHANRPMWVSGITSITVNSQTVTPGGGTPGSYEGSKGNGGDTQTDTADNTVSAALEASVQITNGTAYAVNTAREIRDTLAALDSGGADVTRKTLSVDARTKQPSGKTVYTLPADALSVLTDDGTAGIKLYTNQGALTFSAELLGFLEGRGSLTIEIAQGDLNGALAAADITVRRGDTAISELGGHLLKAELGYDAPDTHSQQGIIVYHAGEDGSKSIVKLAAYSGGTVKMALRHLSRYEVSYNPVTFTDIESHWGRSGIEFLAARDIVKGYSDGLFSPDRQATRAEFIKMLAETAGITESENLINAGFSDVPSSAWYAGYITWAARLAIAQGYPDGSFKPDGLITREEMAVMMQRFIAAVGYKLKNTRDAAEYADSEQIGAFAADAVSAVRRYGIMGGNPDGAFYPKNAATRAEAAQVLAALIEAVLN